MSGSDTALPDTRRSPRLAPGGYTTGTPGPPNGRTPLSPGSIGSWKTSSRNVPPEWSDGRKQQDFVQLMEIRSIEDLRGLPDMSPEALERLLRNHNLVLHPDGTITKKHIYHVRRMHPGRCGFCNQCCGGCCDDHRCCRCCNKRGICERGKYLLRRESGDSNASVWSTVTAMPMREKPRSGYCC